MPTIIDPANKPKTIAELFSDPSRWTMGYLARDVCGNPLGPTHTMAICWCIVGASYYIYGPRKAEEVLHKMKEKIGGDIVDYNDEHGYDDVLRLVRELGI